MSEDPTPAAPQAPDKPAPQRPVQTAAQVFAYDSHAVRTVSGDDGEVWFVATDVLSALELDRKAIERVDDDEKGVKIVRLSGMTCGNRSHE
jgi:prophage antirepressor-like protein